MGSLDIKRSYQIVKNNLDYAVTVMRHVIAQCIEGGSFRTFIYNRLGFGPEAYVPMYEAGVMEFTNVCPVNMAPEVAPSFAWAGVGIASKVSDKEITVEFEHSSLADHHLSNTVMKGPGSESINKGDHVLVVYLSSSSGGLQYALPLETNFAAWHLAAQINQEE